MWFERFAPCKRIDYFATLSTPFLGGQQPVMHGGAGLGRTRAEKVDCISSEVGRIQASPPPWQSLFFGFKLSTLEESCCSFHPHNNFTPLTSDHGGNKLIAFYQSLLCITVWGESVRSPHSPPSYPRSPPWYI